jgi:hypothetical protein
MLRFTLPLDCPEAAIFSTVGVDMRCMSTGLGCHIGSVNTVTINMDQAIKGDDPKIYLKDPWGNYTMSPQARLALTTIPKDKQIRDAAFAFLWLHNHSYLTNHTFLCISDNLDGMYNAASIVTGWFAEWLVDVKGFVGIASPVALNANYPHAYHHNQIWILTPPEKIYKVIRGSHSILGKYPDESKTYLRRKQGEPTSAFEGEKINSPFMEITERRMAKAIENKDKKKTTKKGTI